MIEQLHLSLGDVVCKEGENSNDLYFLKDGQLLVCTVVGTQVKVFGRINPGEFVGELSFFDEKPRAAHVVATEKSLVYKITTQEVRDNLPFWFKEVGKALTKKIRALDSVVQESNIRKTSMEVHKQLTIDEQRKILSSLNK
jgi:CRP/FNR family cyclic AMP-dependent transcriptional regulator